MGPRLVSWVSKKTNIRYSIALLPIGGFVMMPGENGEDAENADDPYANDPNTFGKKPVWQRFIITAAGATVNIVAGFLAMFIITLSVDFGGTTVGKFYDSEEIAELSEYYGAQISVTSRECGLQENDKILKIDGKRVRILDEVSYEIMRRGNEPVDIVIERDGEKITLYDVVFPIAMQQEQTFGLMDFRIYRVDKTFGSVMKYTFVKGALIVRMVWESLIDLITGRYSFAAVSGPIGISSAIGDAAKAGFISLLNMVVLISINLGVMNLIPFPALDGGRLATQLIEIITRKKLPAKVEGIINAAGFAILMTFMLIVMIKDIFAFI
jgi:regulator of sigma E protease